MRENLKVVATGEDAPVQKVIATGISLVIGLSDNQQLTFQSGYEGDEDDSSINARLDRMLSFAGRLRARAQIPDIARAIAKHRKDMATFQELIDRAEQEQPHQIATRQVEIDEMKRLRADMRARKLAEMDAQLLDLQERRKEFFNNGLEEHRKRGRQGSYTPSGSVAATLKNIDTAIDAAGKARDADIEAWDREYDAMIAAAEADLHKKEEERLQTIAGHKITIGRHEEAIAELNEQLAECQKLLGG